MAKHSLKFPSYFKSLPKGMIEEHNAKQDEKKEHMAKKMNKNKGVLISENRRHSHVRFGDPK